MRRLLLIPIALLGGCTVNLQRPAAQSDWIAQHADAARCPLELIDARRRAPLEVDAAGVPTPLVARAIGQAGKDRELRVGDSLALV
ncbi:MAG: hypothetical protein JSR15_13110, partial [Proteobacteria bacterium]|nr:hypothetical protein [Pseudomonadota bacterium]